MTWHDVLYLGGLMFAVLGGVWFGAEKKLDVRVNVLVLALVVAVIVIVAFRYAADVGTAPKALMDNLIATVTSDAATAQAKMDALLQLLTVERSFTRDMLGWSNVATAAITGLIGAIGFLLRGENDLKQPHNKLIDSVGSALGEDARAGRLRAAVDKTKEAVDKMGQDR